jgi:hypothetical protein
MRRAGRCPCDGEREREAADPSVRGAPSDEILGELIELRFAVHSDADSSAVETSLPNIRKGRGETPPDRTVARENEIGGGGTGAVQSSRFPVFKRRIE